MTALTRLWLAGLVVATLAACGVGAVFGVGWLQGWATGVFLFVELGIAPCLLLRPMPASWFALLAVTGSLAGTISVGFTMAILHLWHPDLALIAVAALTLALLIPVTLREIGRLRGEAGPARRHRPSRADVVVAATTAAGLLAVVLAAATHQGPPRQAGLFLVVGPLWYVGLALLVAATAYAWRRRVTPALPILTLSSVVVLSQAIVYGSPTVATAARHVGIVQYIRANGGLSPSLDIYQSWSGLFAGTAWLCDAGRIADPMIVATWWPVLLSAATTLAVTLLAGRWLRSGSRAWLAGAIFALTETLNIVYFSPQSIGILISLVIFALAVSPRRIGATPRRSGADPMPRPHHRLAAAYAPLGAGRLVFILYLSCVSAVTHQISPYLTVAALALLWIMGYLRPVWTLLLIIAPALAWAGANTDVLGRFISLGAVGRFWENAQSPAHTDTQFATPLVTRLAFEIPAVVLLALGLAAAYAVLRQRTRPAWALALAGASPVTLFAVTNYGQEGIFRVTLFAAPWLAVLAAAIPWPAPARRWRTPALAAGLAVLLGANVFGQTALDWNRVTSQDTARATALYENTAPRGSLLLLTGTSVVSPINISARYLDVTYVGRESLGGFPPPDRPYDAAADVATLTRRLVTQWPASGYYALVSETIGAYDARYGYQNYAEYRKLAAAMAASPLWRPIFHGPTTTLYVLAKKPAG